MKTRWWRPREAIRRRPLLGDLALSLAALAIFALEARPVLVASEPLLGPYTAPDTLATLLFLLVAGPVLARRRAPFAAAAVTLVAAFAYRAFGYPPFASVDLVALLMTYSWAAHSSRTGAKLGAAGLGGWVAALQLASPTPFEPLDYGVLLVVFEGAWLLGRSVRTQRAQARVLAQQVAEHAVAAERARIARELHDVVAHHVSVVVVQAQGASAALADDPAASGVALGHIEESGREALAELRRLLGILREAPALDDRLAKPAAAIEGRAPQPSVAALDDLLARMQASGLHVDVALEGRVAVIPPTVGVAGYRIVQEALTNTLRHAPGARASIVLRYCDDAIEIEVTDDGGRGRQRAVPGAAGHGHYGISERAKLLGGTVDIGPRAGSGYRVWARLPLARGPA